MADSRDTQARPRPGRPHPQMCIEMGGSITGEHGVGVEKLDTCPSCLMPRKWKYGAPARCLRSTGICNPGKKFRRAEGTEMIHP